jgi:hypothetical protein
MKMNEYIAFDRSLGRLLFSFPDLRTRHGRETFLLVKSWQFPPLSKSFLNPIHHKLLFMLPKSTGILCPLLLVLFISSCSKTRSAGVPASSCRINYITDSNNGGITSYNLSYNNLAKLSAITQDPSGGYTIVFAYVSNTALTTRFNGPAILETDSIVLNAAGNPSMEIRTDSSGIRTVYTFNYNGSGQILSSTYQYNGGTVTTTVYTYTNGDPTSYTDGVNTTTLSFDLSKPSAPGDYLYISQLFSLGTQFLKSKHLNQGLQQGSTTVNFTYTFDSLGNIKSLGATSGASVQSISYQYQCNL